MNEYKVYCYISPSGKKYIGQTKLSLSQRAGIGGKSEAIKKMWERRRCNDNGE